MVAGVEERAGSLALAIGSEVSQVHSLDEALDAVAAQLQKAGLVDWMGINVSPKPGAKLSGTYSRIAGRRLDLPYLLRKGMDDAIASDPMWAALYASPEGTVLSVADVFDRRDEQHLSVI